MQFVNNLLRRAQPEETSAFNLGSDGESFLNLSFGKRITLFITFLGVGLFFMFISTWMIFSPRAFAKFYTLGTLSVIASTFFLVGPRKQLQSMFHPSRIVAAGIYIGSAVGTLFCALSLQNTLLTMLMIGIQFCAAMWYGASYIPFAQDCLRGTAKKMIPILPI